MLKIRLLFAISFITASYFFYSCKKCELDLSKPDKKESILLKIDETENSYVDQNGNPFYSGVFKSIQDTILFKVPMEAGVKYQIYCSRSEPIYDVQMYLLDSNLDTISKALFYPPYLTEMFFIPANSDNYYVGLKLSDSYNQDLRYKLYFEKIEENNFSFCEKNWEGLGHWESTDEQTIKYNCSESQNIKWLRLIQAIKPNSKISFTVRADTNNIPSVGFAFAETYELLESGRFQEKLPRQGSYFNFNDTTSFRMAYIGKEFTDGYIYAFLDAKNVNPKEGIKFEIVPIENAHYRIYINNKPLNYTFATYSYTRFYLIIEDISQSDVYFENFKIEEI